MATTGLLFFHAFPLDQTMWEPQRAAFADVPIVTVNFPGIESSPYASTMNGAADSAAAAMRKAGLDKAVVVGLSMGGYMALAFQRLHPKLAAGYVFANTRGDADDEAAKERRHALATRVRTEGQQFLLDAPPPLLSANAPAELWDRVKAIIANQPPEAIAREAEAMAARPDSMADLAKITVPVLVVTSSNDTLIPPAISEQMAAAAPGSRLEVIQGAGHLSNLEAADRFNELLKSFLAECGA